MHRHRSARRVFAIFVAAALIASMAGIVPAGAAPQDRGGTPKLPSKVTSGSLDVAGAKLDARLAELVSKAGREGTAAEAVVEVAVLAARGAKKPAEMIRPLKMTLRGDPANDLWVGTAKVGKLLKLASAKDVVFVFENGRREPEGVEDSGGGGPEMTDFQKKSAAAKVQARLDAALDAGAAEIFRDQFDDEGVLKEAATDPIDYDGGAATGWFDVSPVGHDSSGAWDQGYRGAGVKVAVADDSCDFGHPDLMGTHAVIDDPASPYDGWPQAFDPFSLLLYTYDAFYGTTYVADGDSWFTDTSATITEADPDFNGAELVTPGTSLSETYHVGYLWDENYYYYFGLDEFPIVLVADENESGVYDTVYVDLDADWDFTTDKPCTKSSPVSYADLWDYDYIAGPDGFADISGGMIYWIADGANQPPGAEFTYYDMDWGSVSAPGSGDMVCFMGALNVDEDHGTLCSSNVVGQGMTDAPSVWGDYPSFKTPDPSSGNGIVQGAAPEAGLVAIADIYWNHFASTLAAYDYAAYGLDEEPFTGDDVQIVSNSYGESDEDADGWDYRSRYVTFLNLYVNNEVSYLFSTGNGAPGYGTAAPPGPATGIAVGASTQMGACGGWDSIYDADQVTAGDVIPWSNRGPNASGGLSPDIVADGAYSSGAVPVNMYWYEGSSSWDIWGGTSRSAPVAAGNLALIFQAYKDRTGFWPNNDMAKDLIMNGARDLNYDTLVQGAGSVNASRSVSIAAGNGGVLVSPSSWNPGDYLGESFTSFANVVHPGESYEGSIRLENTGADPAVVSMSDAWYQQTGVDSFDVTLTKAELSGYDFSRPDYLLDITDMIPDGTDLVVLRTTQGIEDFAPTGAFDIGGTTHNVTRPLVYDWKDQDTSGTLWTDSDTDGFVDEGEIDEGEYMRFTYHNNFANTHELRVQTPKERMHDGVYFGLQWASRADVSASTSIHVEVTFWNRTDCDWLEFDGGGVVSAGTAVARPVTLNVPTDAPVGIYEAQLRLDDGTDVAVVPVVINVAADTYAFEFGNATMVPTALMSNREVYGTQDWRWRAESGDWRFFWTDGSAADELPLGAAWLVRTIWEDRGAPAGMDTDLDTLLYGPELDIFSDYFPNDFGPYALGLKGGSANNNIGAGIWTFQTNSGTTEEWVAGSLEAGLNQVMVHNVLYDGKSVGQTFSGETGVISVDPGRLDIVSAADSATEYLDFTTYDLDLTGAAVQAYGLSKRVVERDTIATGDDWYYFMDLADAAYLDVQTTCPGQDIDLYVYWWNGSTYVLVGASETSSDEESVRLTMPADGEYVVDVYGYSVSGTQEFDVSISAPMGNDMVLSGIPAGSIDAGSGFTLDVDWTKVRSGALEDREGEYEGVIFIGPTEAPGAVQVPVTLKYPFEIESSTPAYNALGVALDTDVSVTFSKRVDPTTLDDTTFFLMKGMEVISGSIAYNDLTATAVFTPDDPLMPHATYEMVIDGVESVDEDVLTTDFSFTTVNDAPVVEDDDYATDEDTELVVTAPGVLANDTDADGDSLSAALVDDVTHGVLALVADGSFTYTPDADWYGTDTFTYKASDGALDSDTATVTITVHSVNDAPVVEDDDYATDEDTELVVTAPGVLANDTDADGDSLSAALVDDVTHGVLALVADGSFTYTPDADWYGTDTFTYEASDDHTGTDQATVTITVHPVPLVVDRIAGEDRILTAIEVSKAGFADDSVETVVIATAYNWPDALGGAALAGAVKGPILLTSPTALPAVVLTEIDRVGATSAIILGGTSAVGTPVEAALNAKLGDANVDRIGGANRYETARNIAARVVDELGPGYDGTAFLATGANFPDALGASPLAAANGWPIYLANPLTGADAALISAMQSDGVGDVLILGGTSAIPAAVAADVAADVPCKTTRLEGATRYETAVDVATYGVSNAGLSWDKLAIATGTNFPDALAGGVLQGKNGSVMLLTTPTALHDSVRAVLEANKLSIDTVYFLGGSNAVSDIVFDAVVDILE